MKKDKWSRRAAAIFGGTLAALGAPAALAQNCVMCYTSAAGQNPHAVRSLNTGIIVLLIPPLTLFAGLFLFLYRRRNARRVEETAVPALRQLAHPS